MLQGEHVRPPNALMFHGAIVCRCRADGLCMAIISSSYLRTGPGGLLLGRRRLLHIWGRLGEAVVGEQMPVSGSSGCGGEMNDWLRAWCPVDDWMVLTDCMGQSLFARG